MHLPLQQSYRYAQDDLVSGVTDKTDAIIIRPAVAQDVDAIHALVVRLAAATGQSEKVTSTPADYLRMGFSDPVAFHALIAERQSVPVGLSLYFYDFSSWRGELGVYVQDLFVAKDVRGAGLGRRLIRETARIARDLGATHIRLSVETSNQPATQFYASMGLSLADNERIYMADGETFVKLAGTL